MTQILSLLTQDYVLIAADSQHSILKGGAWHIARDDAAKLVYFFKENSFGAYAGSTILGSEPTPIWMARAMCRTESKSLHDTVEAIQKNCISSMPSGYRGREQHFIFTGFARFAQSEVQKPYLVLVSNMIDSRGRALWKPGPMRLRPMALEPDQLFGFHVGGQQLSRQRHRRLSDKIATMVSTDTEPAVILRHMAKEIRFTSGGRQTRNRWVGRRVLGGFVPRPSADQLTKRILFASEPNRKNPWSSYSIYDTNGNYRHEPVGLIGTTGRFIAEMVATEIDDRDHSRTMKLRYILAPDPRDPLATGMRLFM